MRSFPVRSGTLLTISIAPYRSFPPATPPWAEVKDRQLAEEDFSLVLSVLYPERYTDPMCWFTSRAGTNPRAESPEEAVAAVRDMLRFRRPGATLFLVVDTRLRFDRIAGRMTAGRVATAVDAVIHGRPKAPWRRKDIHHKDTEIHKG